MDGFFYAKLAYEAFHNGSPFLKAPPFAELGEKHREAWKRAADAVLSGQPPIESTIPPPAPLEDIINDPDSSPTPIEVPHPQHGKE